MSITPKQLLDRAIQAAAEAYIPISNFPVGAAVLGESGEVYTGCNIENSSYGLTMCAERVAIFKAISSGENRISMIACACLKGTTDNINSLISCGACLQVMNEFMDDDSQVVIGVAGVPRVFLLKELLPIGFRF